MLRELKIVVAEDGRKGAVRIHMRKADLLAHWGLHQCTGNLLGSVRGRGGLGS